MNLYTSLLPGDLGRPFLDLPAPSTVDGPTLTYGDVDERVRRFETALGEVGVGRGDRVVIQSPKSVDALALMLACVRSRSIFIPLNTAYTTAEVEYFVNDADAALVVCDPDRLDDFEATFASERRIVTLGGPRSEASWRSSGSVAELADRCEPTTSAPETGDELDPAAMLYTSGTTGRSKGAVLTHASLLANAEALRDVWAIRADDSICHTLPIFHVHGLFVALFPLMLQGARLRFRLRFDVEDVLVQLGASTVLMGVPTHYVRLLGDDRFDAALTSHIRLFTSGSAPMTEQTHAEFSERTGTNIVERYGMTETGILTSNLLGQGGQVPGTVGFALPGHAVRVVGEDGVVVAAGGSGEVEVSLPVPFAGYWRQPDKTAASLAEDGWFRTGDIGSMDDTGRLSLDGRASDMIISGGYNVYPKEIEIVLDAVPGVVESAVVGVPHPDFGEGVIAVVVLHGDESSTMTALEQACGAALARFKHPKHFIAVDALPRNAMAKVQKNELRKRYVEVFTT